MSTYQAINLIARPNPGPVDASVFEVVNVQTAPLEQGQFRVKQSHMSLDPAMFGWMSADTESYIPPVELGAVMRSSGIGEVIESLNTDFAVGDKVMGMFGWQELAVSNGVGINKIDPTMNEEMVLSIFALPGLTAVQGLFNVAKPKSGETILVTGAAGSVGSIVGQLAKAEGLNVIGVVGSDEKAKWIVEELGFDAAINYKSNNLDEKLAKYAPNGIDVFFENTGGAIQKLAFERMNAHGRVAVCGLIADYSATEPASGPSWLNLIKKRITVQGYTMPDHLHNAPALLEQLTPYVMQGKIKYRAHVLNGLESAIDGLNLFFTGENKCKLIVKL